MRCPRTRFHCQVAPWCLLGRSLVHPRCAQRRGTPTVKLRAYSSPPPNSLSASGRSAARKRNLVWVKWKMLSLKKRKQLSLKRTKMPSLKRQNYKVWIRLKRASLSETKSKKCKGNQCFCTLRPSGKQVWDGKTAKSEVQKQASLKRQKTSKSESD